MESIERFIKLCTLRVVRLLLSVRRRETAHEAVLTNILVVRQHDQLGDMLCAVPLLRVLRERYPTCSITLVTSGINHEIMLHHPFVDEVLLYPKGKLVKIVGFLRTLRRKSFQLAIVPSTVSFSFTSALISLASKASIRVGPRAINGMENSSGFCYTLPVDLRWDSDPHRHQAKRNLDILQPLGLTSDNLSTTIGLTEEEIKAAAQTLSDFRQKYRCLVGMHPGAGKIVNRWDVSRFAALANRLNREQAAGIVITAGPMDDAVIGNLLPSLRCEYLLLQRKPIRHVAAVINDLNLFIVNDTGIMHVAGATSVQLLALFGPTDPLQWAPVGSKNHYVRARGGDLRQLSEEEVYQMALLSLPSGTKSPD